MGPEVCAAISSSANDDKLLNKLYYSKNSLARVNNITNNLNKQHNNSGLNEPKSNNKNLIKSEPQLREIETRRLWQKADAVCFDVDSTVCQDEAIDEFANFLGKGKEVALCTQQAMGGNMSFREALRLRLNLMHPTRAQMEEYADSHKIRLTNGISELISELQQRNIPVYLISGGFRRLILPIADLLGIPRSHVYANELLFDGNGNYNGFDLSEPTSDNGNKSVGKAGVCGQLKAKNGYKRLIMIGDGATDAEACPPADAFVGFGGNQVRENVRKLSNWYVYDFRTLIDELKTPQNME